MPDILEQMGITKEEFAEVVALASAKLEGEDSEAGSPGKTKSEEADIKLTAGQWKALGILRKETTETAAVDPAKALDPTDEAEEKRFKAPAIHSKEWTQDDIKNFSIARAAQYVVFGEMPSKGSFVGNELERDVIKGYSPDEGRVKDLNLESQVAGGFLVPTVVVNDLIGQYSARTIIRRAGAMIIPNAGKETTVPKKTGNTTAYWVGDAPTSDITASAPTFGELALTLRPLAAAIEVRKNLIKDSPLSVEAIVRADVVEQMALAEDLGFIQGLGGKEPTGLKNWPNIATYTTSSVGTPDFDELLNARTALLARNIPLSAENSSWWMHPNVLGYLQKHKTGVGQYDYVIDLTARPPDRILGLPVYTSSQIPITLGGGDETYIVLCGVGGDYAVADGGQLEILVDPYTLSRKLQVQLIAVHEVDGGPRRLESFQLLTGVQTA